MVLVANILLGWKVCINHIGKCDEHAFPSQGQEQYMYTVHTLYNAVADPGISKRGARSRGGRIVGVWRLF